MGEVKLSLNSYDEWSHLREVIVGSATGLSQYDVDNTFAAFYFENIYGPIERMATPRKNVSPGYLTFASHIVEELEEDIADLVKALEDFGTRVLRPAPAIAATNIETPYWRANSTTPLNVRDQTIILGRAIIETAPHIRARLFENDYLKPIFQEYFDTGASWLSMPRPTLGRNSIDVSYLVDNGYAPEGTLPDDVSLFVEGLGYEIIFDGAQCIRLGRDVLVNVANKNHELALVWLRRSLGHEFNFIGIYRLADSHIDSFVLPLRPGLLLLRSPSVLAYLPEELSTWDTVIAPPVDEPRFPKYPGPLTGLASKYIDMNLLSLDENTVIVNSLYPELITELEAKKFTVIPVRHRHRRLFGGGFHCFTLDCVRDGGAERYLGGLFLSESRGSDDR